jgi:hypothetical protein
VGKIGKICKVNKVDARKSLSRMSFGMLFWVLVLVSASASAKLISKMQLQIAGTFR